MFEILDYLTREEMVELADIICGKNLRSVYGYDDDKKSKEDIFKSPIQKWLEDRLSIDHNDFIREECKRMYGNEVDIDKCRKKHFDKYIKIKLAKKYKDKKTGAIIQEPAHTELDPELWKKYIKYLDMKVVQRCADWFKIQYVEKMPIKALEDEIMSQVIKHLEKQIKKMKPELRKKFAKELASLLDKEFSSKGLALSGAALTSAIVAGELTGFGIFLATTTGLKALSLALGVTFGWTVYQGAAVTLGVVLGPIGWALSGIVLLGGISKWVARSNWRKFVNFSIACISKKNELRQKGEL